MPTLDNYQKLVESIFGKQTSIVRQARFAPNQVLVALNNSHYSKLINAFSTRLRRLFEMYTDNSGNTDLQVLKAVQDLAYMNTWEGAYAELAAYDYFAYHGTSWLPKNPILGIDEDAVNTLGENYSKTITNYDGKLISTFFDVKVFQDKVKVIVDNIVKEALHKYGTYVLVMHNYPLDIGFDPIANNRGLLYNELLEFLSSSRSGSFTSKVVKELSYTIVRKKGVATSETSYNSYKYAEMNSDFLFKHAKKFHKSEPTLIVFVLFPWFSDIHYTNDFFEKMYRPFSRRFFCQYKHRRFLARSRIDGFHGNSSLFDVTKKLSGLLFLEDELLTSDDSNNRNMNAYTYMNPNADNPTGSLMQDYFRTHDTHYEDFQWDNY